MAALSNIAVMLNRPGPGWYWEVIHKHEILARGLANSHSEAEAQPQQPYSRRKRRALALILSS